MKQFFDESSFNSAFATVLAPRYNIIFIGTVLNIDFNSIRNELMNTLITYDEPKLYQTPKMVVTMVDRINK